MPLTPVQPGITGVILAGGQSTRMGGADKGLAMLHGKALVAWVIERLRPQVDQLVISTNTPQAYAAFGLPTIADDPQTRGAGPLAGMLSGLKAATTDWVVSVPCDAPHLPVDLVPQLKAALDAGDNDLAVATTADGMQPVFCLMRRSDWPTMRDYLLSGRRRADGWYGELQVEKVPFSDAAAFANINTPEALAALNAAPHP